MSENLLLVALRNWHESKFDCSGLSNNKSNQTEIAEVGDTASSNWQRFAKSNKRFVSRRHLATSKFKNSYEANFLNLDSLVAHQGPSSISEAHCYRSGHTLSSFFEMGS